LPHRGANNTSRSSSHARRRLAIDGLLIDSCLFPLRERMSLPASQTASLTTEVHQTRGLSLMPCRAASRRGRAARHFSKPLGRASSPFFNFV
jgi:hypothetical protein